MALSIFTCSHPHTIVDEPELNFCVRDGNRWTLRTINTNFSYAALASSVLIIARFPHLSSSIFENFKIFFFENFKIF